LGDFLFEGVREGFFRLTAKDTLTNRRASASRTLSQADPAPVVPLEHEPTDTGGNSNVLVPIVEVEVTQRCQPCDFLRALQGNPLQMEGVLENSPYNVTVKEIGGLGRELRTSASFPKGSAADPLKLVLQAYGSVEVHVIQGGAPAANARVSVSGGGRSA